MTSPRQARSTHSWYLSVIYGRDACLSRCLFFYFVIGTQTLLPQSLTLLLQQNFRSRNGAFSINNNNNNNNGSNCHGDCKSIRLQSFAVQLNAPPQSLVESFEQGAGSPKILKQYNL